MSKNRVIKSVAFDFETFSKLETLRAGRTRFLTTFVNEAVKEKLDMAKKERK